MTRNKNPAHEAKNILLMHGSCPGLLLKCSYWSLSNWLPLAYTYIFTNGQNVAFMSTVTDM